MHHQMLSLHKNHLSHPFQDKSFIAQFLKEEQVVIRVPVERKAAQLEGLIDGNVLVLLQRAVNERLFPALISCVGQDGVESHPEGEFRWLLAPKVHILDRQLDVIYDLLRHFVQIALVLFVFLFVALFLQFFEPLICIIQNYFQFFLYGGQVIEIPLVSLERTCYDIDVFDKNFDRLGGEFRPRYTYLDFPDFAVHQLERELKHLQRLFL